MLIEHRIDDVNERFIAAEEAVPAGEQVTFEPTLALMLAQHLHDTPVGSDMRIGRLDLGDRGPCRDVEHSVPAIRGRLIRAEDAEVAALLVQLHDVADVRTLHARRFGVDGARRLDLDGIVAKVR